MCDICREYASFVHRLFKLEAMSGGAKLTQRSAAWTASDMYQDMHVSHSGYTPVDNSSCKVFTLFVIVVSTGARTQEVSIVNVNYRLHCRLWLVLQCNDDYGVHAPRMPLKTLRRKTLLFLISPCHSSVDGHAAI